MDRLFAKEDPTPLLQEYPRGQSGGWYVTPYGCAFKLANVNRDSPGSDAGALWAYHYTKEPAARPPLGADDLSGPGDLGAPELQVHGVLSGADVAKALRALRADPAALAKPQAIRSLEALTGCTARRKSNMFGAWQMWSDGPGFSLFNNPFGVSIGYTDAATNFEVLFDGEDEPEEYVSLERVVATLRARGFARGHPCAKCGRGGAREVCSRCHAARYCAGECQRADWPAHRLVCRLG